MTTGALSCPPQTSHWLEILQSLLLNDNVELQLRGVVIAHNMMQAERGLAEQLMESEALEILSVLAKGGAPGQGPVARTAKQCLDVALEYGFIKSTGGQGEGAHSAEP